MEPPIIAGVIGDPISHSLSPRLHGYWLHQKAINGYYIPLHVVADDLEKSISSARQLGFSGLNITLPHKQAVLELADEITPEARAIGAANTLFFRENRILAHNTDAYGLAQNLRQSVPGRSFVGETALVIGAGGAARAAVYALQNLGLSKIFISNRTVEKATKLAGQFGRLIEPFGADALADLVGRASLIINTTSLGMVGQPPLDLSLATAQPDTVIYDLVYNPLETELLKQAKFQGLTTVKGLGMLLHQAVPGFEGWFGQTPTVTSALRDHMLGFLR